MKLDDIAKKLLDLGKRNRLLNYKDSGLKNMDILNQNYKDIYEGVSSGKELSFLITDKLLQAYRKTITGKEDDVIEDYSKEKVYSIVIDACKPNQLIGYKKGISLEKVLKALVKEYKYSITEKGINSLYLSFGFVNYKEDNTLYKAPLLLIPVDLYKNNKGEYRIHAADDDIILNPTLDYYFNTYYHFDIPDYAKEDFDYLEYMEDIKKVLPEDIIYEDGMSIGIYSFLKMNMYKDLVDHKDKVLANKNINALLGDPTSFEEIPGSISYPVVNCDSSQLNAIDMAVKGKSFVLQGPPGSGKSQTITNIIASLIGNGRHVLFVSEKLQALQVVYENLRRAGLEDFAIELHSSKANKKTFIENLYKTAILPKYAVSSMADDTKTGHEISKKFLENYNDALKATVTGEKLSVYELFSMYMGLPNEEIKYRILNIEKHPILESQSVERYLREYKNAIESIGYNYKETPFYGLNELSSSYLSYDLDKEFLASIKYLNLIKEYLEKLNTNLSYNGKDIASIKELLSVLEFITIYNQLEFESNSYYDKEINTKLQGLAKKYLELNTKSAVLKNYDKEFLNENLAQIYRSYKGFSGLFKSFNGEYRSLKRQILSFRNEKAKDKILIEELKELLTIKNNLIERKALKKEITEYLPFASNENMNKIYDELKLIEPYCGIVPKVSKDECKNELLDVLLSFNNHQDMDKEYKILSSRFDGSILDLYKDSVKIISSKLEEIYKLRDNIPSYIRALTAINEIDKLGFVGFLDEYLLLGKSLDNMDKVFRKTFFQNKVFYEIHKNPMLEGFSSNLFKERVHEFNTYDEQILRLNRDYIISLNSMKRPDDALVEGSKFKILAKEANKVRKQKPVRVLLSEIYDLAIDIKPVFLMSPLSVSTYLTEDNQFDCVIFDEASQIFAEDAFGAIYRGKQCIIIGDSKQMPPSNFFGAQLENIDDEDDYDAGIESILDMGASFLPSLSLKWHYRSRSEELIAFSNKAFYDSTLITIPEAHKHETGFGIDFIYIPNGQYDMKSRTNRKEAEKISDMVIEHYKTSNKSLGVVAFSKVQAELIEDLVEKKAYNYPELAKYFSDEVDEPFFVKNLETVQGDERDRIIFSVCYGYNSDGKFFQRFGPLNNLGGERRLNVAVTRSKYNITIVSSIRYTDIKDGNTDSVGVKLLKEYLEFAENIVANKKSSETEDGIINSLKKFLEENDYEVTTNYGASSFTIPLAVKEKGADNYLAAVMLENFSENRNTTDNNRLEKLLLERQGWKYYKIYSTGYITDKKEEEEKLLDFLRTKEEEKEETVEIPTFIEETDTSLETHFSKYKALPIDKLKSYYEKHGLKFALTKMLEVEQPINKDYLYRRAAEAMGRVKVTNVVKNETAKQFPDNMQTVGNTLWITIKDDVVLRLDSTRMLNEIPIEEIKHGLYTIISLNAGITVDGAYKTLIKLLGFSRLTENAKKTLDDAIVFLKLDGKIIQKGECLYV